MTTPILSGIFGHLKSALPLTTLAIIVATTAGCNNDDDNNAPVVEAPAPQIEAHYVLARVDGGSCSLFDAETGIDLVAGPATTDKGVATFSETPAPLGSFLLECAGGRYIDEATGYYFTGELLRSYVNITADSMVVTATPLTELAARIVEDNDELTVADYPSILANVAVSFGMEEFDLSTSVPMDLNVEEADGSAGGRYAVVLAGLSQLQLDTEVGNLEDLLQLLQVGLANNGQFTDDEIQEQYFFALENTFSNPLIDPNLGYDEDLDALFSAVAKAPKASQVEYVDAAHDNLTQEGEAHTTIDPNVESTFEIVGTHLFLGMDVTLGEDVCTTSDLQLLHETNADYTHSLMFAHCPARDPGLADLVVTDRGRVENVTEITISEVAQTAEVNLSHSTLYANNADEAITSAPVNFLSGKITAEAPGIAPPHAAHNYHKDALEIFPVAGVSVDLINSAGEVVETSFTNVNGDYGFIAAPSGDVRIIVKAEVKRERSAGTTTGAQYNFSVRDNTSTSSPKKLYQVVSDPVTIPPGEFNFSNLDVRINIGFDENGNAMGNVARQSAPFAILRIVKSAADKLEAINANITMPTLNLYWSGDNLAAVGDKALGQISTSHYAGSGTFPGVFILGKADADTDEFDQGVIGHEFGHYLQAQLSFSDNPGGGHSGGQYKDASLAYGEGYGTAVGGLLSSGANSNYYCDVRGYAQTGGFCNDLNAEAFYGVNGFYAENSVTHLMYKIGKIEGKGFTAFFNAVTAMKHDVHSATIFAFLDKYVKANPDVKDQVDALMAITNIKTTDPLGTLPAGAVTDPAIAATANKGATSEGANLEQIYVNYPLKTSVAAPSFGDPAAPLSIDNAPTFCINHNLYGSNNQNGLGMLKRFMVKPDFTGRLLLRAEDKNGNSLQNSGVYWNIRDESGTEVRAQGYGGPDRGVYYGYINVEAGKEYSIRTHAFYPASILNGNICGNKLALARANAF